MYGFRTPPPTEIEGGDYGRVLPTILTFDLILYAFHGITPP